MQHIYIFYADLNKLYYVDFAYIKYYATGIINYTYSYLYLCILEHYYLCGKLTNN